MELNHHIMAKTATEAILHKFKSQEWVCKGEDGLAYGHEFTRINASSDFPSPDASFVDENRQIVASFEFKPPTETKRGILTGLGQAIAYLNKSSISFLVIPSYLDSFAMGNYMKELFDVYITSKLPVGLVVYDCNDASNVSLLCGVDGQARKIAKKEIKSCGRYWAKHQDLPISLFHLVLHYYFLKKIKSGVFSQDSDNVDIDAFAECWKDRMISKSVSKDFSVTPIYDVFGNVIKTMNGEDKTYLGNTIASLRKKYDDESKISRELELRISTSRPDICRKGEEWGSSYKPIRKNILSFMKHIQVIDSSLNITEKGIKLYNLGLINGLSSKLFLDYFTKEVLTTGRHIDLLIDFNSYVLNNKGCTLSKICEEMQKDYNRKGLLKLNEARVTGDASQKAFLSYELVLWHHLRLVNDNNLVDFKRIIEVCTLPEL